MKRRLFSTLTAAILAGITFTGCDKKPDPAPPTDKTQPAKPGEPAKPAEPGKPSAETKAPAAPAPGDVAKIAGAYGFAARLPKDVEAFSANYRLHEMWLSIVNSKWAETLLAIPQLKDEPGFQQAREQWASPQGEQVRTMLAGILGQEMVFGMPSGFAAKVQPWQDLMVIYYKTIFQGMMFGQIGAGADPARMQALLRNAAPDLIPALTKCEMPPMLMAYKAAQVRDVINGGTAQLMGMVGTALPPAIEAVSYKVDGKYEFTGISVNAKKLIAQFQEVQLELQLKEILGDEKKAKEAMDGIINKKFEISWGWVDDYFVVALGSDHAHVKFAGSAADSVLANPEVALRAGQFADKKPTSIAYTSKAFFDAMNIKVEFANAFKSVAGELEGILKPEHVEAMIADVKKLEAKAQSLFTTTYDAQVQIGWIEGGLRGEMFGGARDTMTDASKPLAFANLATPASFLFLNGRSNGASSKAMLDFAEEGAATLWTWYEKYGRTMVPESERQGAAMVEATALPLLKEAWKATRSLGAALGDESAFIFDTVGAMPEIPGMPPFLAEGKVPRLAYVVELKDRAALSASWTGFNSIIKQLTALADGAPPMEPQMKKDGDVELHFIPLPVPTGDLLPHIAITKDRWMLSTAPSFSKELAGKPANTSGQPLGGHAIVNFTALYDHLDVWLKVLDKNASEIFPGQQGEQFKEARPLIGTGLKLARSFQGIEVKTSQENGQTRASAHIKLQDVK